MTNGYKLDKFHFRKDIDKYWFGNKVVDTWNHLPSKAVGAEHKKLGALLKAY